MKDFKFCPMCKSDLERKPIEGRERLVCAACGWVNYRNPVPVAACLVSNPEGGLLLIRRSIDPCKGAWALPGGFIELDETIAEAGRRELKEETGLDGEPLTLVGAHIQESVMYGAVLIVGMEFRIVEGEMTPGDDASDVKFIPRSDLPELPFSSHRKLVEEYYM